MIDQDVLDALTPFAEALENMGVPYYIGGSVASTAWGIPRTTIDIDLVAHLRAEHISFLVEQLEDTYYVAAEMIEDAVEQGGSFNVIHSSSIKIDVFVPRFSARNEVEAGRVQQRVLDAETSGRVFPVSSAEDIVLRKLEWYKLGGGVSERQWLDVLGVLKVQSKNLDFGYLAQWASVLGIDDLLGMALEDAGLSYPL